MPVWFVAVALACAVAVGAYAEVASAKQDSKVLCKNGQEQCAPQEPNLPFDPTIKFNFSTQKAGGNPEMAVRLEKSIWKCRDKPSGLCPNEDFLRQQNFKDINIKLPNGLLFNPNATEGYCHQRITDFGYGTHAYECDKGSRIGGGEIWLQACGQDPAPSLAWECALDYDGPPWIWDIWTLGLYNEEPLEGDHGRVRIFISDYWESSNHEYAAASDAADLRVKIDEPVTDELHINLIGENLPDTWYDLFYDSEVGGSWPLMDLTTDGTVGAEKGTPLIELPRLCQSDPIDTVFQGWAYNSVAERNDYGNHSVITEPAHDEGKEQTASDPFEATDCNELDYTPGMSIVRDTTQSRQYPSTTFNLSQDSEEATTKSAEIVLPKVGVNLYNSVQLCPEEAVSRFECPESSKIGNGTGVSPFLPKDEPPLQGGVYLTDIQPDGSFGTAIMLDGFIKVLLRGSAKPEGGNLVIKVDNAPPAPMTNFAITLDGGKERGLLTNSSTCGTENVKTKLISHTGVVSESEIPYETTGCSEVKEFDVRLSDTARGKPTSVQFDLSDNRAKLSSVKFHLSRYLKISPKRLKRQRHYGQLSLTSSSGSLQESSIKRAVIGTKGKNSKSKSKSVSKLKTNSILGGLTTNLYADRVTSKAAKRFSINIKRTKSGRRTVPKFRLSMSGLPDNTSDVSTTLNDRETTFIRNAKGCVRYSFVADVKTKDGSSYQLKKAVKMGCKKIKAKRAKKKATRKSS